MAARILNRRELREQAERAEREAAGGAVPVPDPAAAKGAKSKKPLAPRPRKARVKKAPTRMVARWGVFDGGLKRVAIFDYNQRAAAEQKLANLLGKQRGIYCLQIVKEPMPEPEAAVVPDAG
jgi:hypothetical protein